MKISNSFLPVQREKPQEAQIISHQLMLQAGLVTQESAGIYTWLPLGLRVLKKIKHHIREGMTSIHCHELLMPTVQSADLWRKTGRYDAYGKETLRFRDRHDRELLYGPTNEDMITEVFGRFVKSYKELPCRLYHIQWKFRDEIRPRFGVMRGREFLMKDGYSFDLTEESAKKTYHEFLRTYVNIFSRMGLKVIPVKAPTGPIGGDLSHEFHIMTKTGESTLYFDKSYFNLDLSNPSAIETLLNLYAAEEEVHAPETMKISEKNICSSKGIEVGHIFYFGDKYTKALNTSVVTSDGKSTYPLCSSYGIGVGRVVAAAIEASHDEKGIIWPEALAPYSIGLLNLAPKKEDVTAICDDFYSKLLSAGVDVLYDDTNESPGSKFARMDLIGLPYQISIGPRGLKEGVFEIKNRQTDERNAISQDSALNYIMKTLKK
jgi:prolyl-tRNA synthetase